MHFVDEKIESLVQQYLVNIVAHFEIKYNQSLEALKSETVNTLITHQCIMADGEITWDRIVQSSKYVDPDGYYNTAIELTLYEVCNAIDSRLGDIGQPLTRAATDVLGSIDTQYE